MKFIDYHIVKELKKSLEKEGFIRPTDIQYKAIPSILKGHDLLAIAQTGTGKTAAFAIPVIDILCRKKIKPKDRNPRCLVIVPTRELALQIEEVFSRLSKYSKLRVLSLIGGIENDEQIKSLDRGVDILVSVPGRMFDLINRKCLTLHNIEFLVIDEADRMLDPSFIKDVKDLMRYIPLRRQTLFFSATINKEIKKLAYSIVRNPIHIQIAPKDPVSKNISHGFITVNHDDKRFFLERLIKEKPESMIMVFVRTKLRAERVLKAMSRAGIEMLSLHGDKNQRERQRSLESFRNKNTKVLVCTDVSSRGIDIKDIDYVINYDLPSVAETYVHRIGRTGRGTRRGIAVSFCSAQEKPFLKAIENYIGKKIQEIKIDKDNYRETIDFSEQSTGSWKELIKEHENKITGNRSRSQKP